MTPEYIWPTAVDGSMPELLDSGNGCGRFSFTALYHYMVRYAWEDLILFLPCMRQRRRKPLTIFGTEEETDKNKNQHVVNFQITKTK